ncbi:hypothetical protein BDB01DRAFT_839494 [Pilobolus umbonatus]|nr:hypothetical protein BDB01DRAFT_839494 [Pilobolus umbonatus]
MIEQGFLLNKDQLKPIVDGFMHEFQTGLKTPSKGLATMIPSYVTKLPTGEEQGTFLSMDLGGTHLRIAAVELKGQGKTEVRELKKSPSPELKTGEGEVFFDWIADAVQEIIARESLLFNEQQRNGKETISLGVCWSFPVDQTGVASGTVLRMGKGFILKNVEGKDLAELFHAAFRRKNLNVVVTAIVNDTVGTLVAHAYTNPKCRIALIFATGINAAYPEKVRNITKLDDREKYASDAKMLINTEIDIFGSEKYLPLTKFDLQLDKSHSQPKFQLYEKMVSGAYMGELTRLIAMDYIHEGSLFEGKVPKGFDQAWCFPTANMSTLENNDHEGISHIFNHFSVTPTSEDIELLTRICRNVSTRAASLVSVAIISLIEQQQLWNRQEHIIIGINGSTFQYYPHMDSRIRNVLNEWYGTDTTGRIDLEVASEGGSVGGALIAMLAK